jgi:Fe2+ transport system protein FeoA
VLVYLGEQGLRPGVRVRVVARAPLGGPLTVESAGRRLALAEALAETLYAEGADTLDT